MGSRCQKSKVRMSCLGKTMVLGVLVVAAAALSCRQVATSLTLALLTGGREEAMGHLEASMVAIAINLLIVLVMAFGLLLQALQLYQNSSSSKGTQDVEKAVALALHLYKCSKNSTESPTKNMDIFEKAQTGVVEGVVSVKEEMEPLILETIAETKYQESLDEECQLLKVARVSSISRLEGVDISHSLDPLVVKESVFEVISGYESGGGSGYGSGEEESSGDEKGINVPTGDTDITSDGNTIKITIGEF